jgi:membrane-bound serine protease (ClpP class)
MEILANPNIAYVLLVIGVFLGTLAIFNPGTGLLELGALLLVVISGWMAYSFEVNLWALVLLVLGVAPFILAMRKTHHMTFLGVALFSFAVGSSFLFKGETWYMPGVNPFLALLASALASGFIWLAARKILEADQARPSHDLDRLINQIGEARSDIHQEGSAQVLGEMWTARSDILIPAHTRIRVIRRDGFVLIVEPA